MRTNGAAGANIRWRDDTGWEMRCDDCNRRRNRPYWWPLTWEFWHPRYQKSDGSWTGKSMTRCRACWVERESRNQRARLQRDPAARARDRARNKAYRAETKAVERIKDRARREQRRAAA